MKAYLDNLATTAIDPRVLDAMLPHLSGPPGNPHARVHPFGIAAADAMDAARADVAATLGVRPAQVTFTPSATAANNLVILGVGGARERRGRHLVVSAIEHPSVLEPARELARRGFALTVLPVGAAGVVDPDAVRAAVRPDTVLVSVMAVNNEVGTEQPIAAIAAVLRGTGVLLHCDAAQAAGKTSLAFAADVDYLTLSGHKAYGPRGIAALVARKNAPAPRPLLFGGGQEGGAWPGTANVAAMVGFARALKLAVDECAADRERIAGLGARLLAGLVDAFPGTRRNGLASTVVPQCLSLCFEGVGGEILLAALARAGVAASLGSACAAQSAEPSHVLTAMGLSAAEARRTLRFGLGRFTTDADLDAALDVVRALAEQVRS